MSKVFFFKKMLSKFSNGISFCILSKFPSGISFCILTKINSGSSPYRLRKSTSRVTPSMLSVFPTPISSLLSKFNGGICSSL